MWPRNETSIGQQYTDWENLSDKYLNQKVLGDLVGDYFFVCPTNIFANVFAEKGGKVYYYYFTQRTSAHPWGDWMGVIHGDEIAYVFGQPLNLSMTSYNARERDLSMRIMQSFSKFSVTGNPGPEDSEWPTYTKENPVYYIYDAVNVGLGKGPRAEACEFWNGLMPEIKAFVDTNLKNCGVQENLKTDFNATRSTGTRNIVDALVLMVAAYAPLLIFGHF
ncbi:hypothetical protein V9T40_004710 [Parthenolecanium corni]|uniref:Carboxylesterase type B domain-containing protein n=1 Tax=Parthenolecanium corni TaxID=536013 RepID=A0AAN9TCS3_9HEMI